MKRKDKPKEPDCIQKIQVSIWRANELEQWWKCVKGKLKGLLLGPISGYPEALADVDKAIDDVVRFEIEHKSTDSQLIVQLMASIHSLQSKDIGESATHAIDQELSALNPILERLIPQDKQDDQMRLGYVTLIVARSLDRLQDKAASVTYDSAIKLIGGSVQAR